jgi:septal ring factor EnvC (AmiA/AmiB activator)
MMKEILGLFGKLMIAAALLSAGSKLPAYSQDTKAQEDRKARLEREIAILDGQIRSSAARHSNALANLTLIQKKVASRKELIAESDKQIASLSREMAAKEKEIRSIQARLDTLSDYYTRLVRSAYKNRDTKIWYMYILASDNVSQAFRRFGYLRDLSKQMNVQATKIKETQFRLEAERATLSELRNTAREVRDQRIAEMSKLQSEEKESQQVVNQLNRDRRQYQQQLDRKRREVETLNREIERIIREATAPAKSQTPTESSKRPPIDYKLAGQFEANKGKLPWPAEGPVVDHFGQHYHPVFTRVKLPFNNGVSVALQKGTAVEAIFNGVVKQIVVMPGYNKCILIQHGNYFTFYCKLGDVNVKAGETVKTGQKIGTVDTINGETQLHFQIWKERDPQDPEVWLRP